MPPDHKPGKRWWQMKLKAPRWWRAWFRDTSEEIEKLRKLRNEAEETLDRTLAQLNADDDYWRRPVDDIMEGLSCGIDERDKG